MLISSLGALKITILKLLVIALFTNMLFSDANDFSFAEPPVIASPLFPFVLYDKSVPIPKSFTILMCDADP